MQIFTQEINLHSECSLHIPCLLLVFFSKQLYFLLKCIPVFFVTLYFSLLARTQNSVLLF